MKQFRVASLLMGLMMLFVSISPAFAMRENPYKLNVEGLTSQQAYEVIQGHLNSLSRSAYRPGDDDLIDAWADKSSDSFDEKKQGTYVWRSLTLGNIPFNWRAYKHNPKAHGYAFHTDKSGWNASSTLEFKKANLTPNEDVKELKVELYDAKQYGFHKEFWLTLVPWAGQVWGIYRGLAGWEYQTTHRDENDEFMKTLQRDLQAKLDAAKKS
jgi:hypothetical protein